MSMINAMLDTRCFKVADVVFILAINGKSNNVGILTIMNKINFRPSWVEHSKSLITSRSDIRPLFHWTNS